MQNINIDLLILITIAVFALIAIGKVFFMLQSTTKSQSHTNQDPINNTLDLTISHPIIKELYHSYSSIMIDQQDVFVGLIGCWLAGGHCLLTGLPGTGKTQAVKTFTQLMGLDMGRVQGTSDLLPADITGSLIYNPKTLEFDTSFGPIVHELVLVDEVNRMPSKTQSALLQAMAEGSIVIGQQTYSLPDHFTVFATQNPHDRIGTFPLPQAQLDRFMCQVIVQSPSIDQQAKILQQTSTETLAVEAISTSQLTQLQSDYNTITVPESTTIAVAKLVQDQGLSSRAGQHIIAFARAIALMQHKAQVEQFDIQISLDYTTKHRTSGK